MVEYFLNFRHFLCTIRKNNSNNNIDNIVFSSYLLIMLFSLEVRFLFLVVFLSFIFQMRCRISVRGRVRPSVGPSVRPSVHWSVLPSVHRSVGPSRVIFEGEKYAYQAHLVPCIRPYFVIHSLSLISYLLLAFQHTSRS